MLTNPTRDQLELLYEWQATMTDAEKSAFHREAFDMRSVYDGLKAGLVDQAEAIDKLKRKDKFESAANRKKQQKKEQAAAAAATAAATAATAGWETGEETKEEPETGFDSLFSSMGGGDATSGRSPMHGEADKKKAAAAGPAEPRRGRGLLANFGGRGGSARSFLGLGGGAAPTQAEAAAAAAASPQALPPPIALAPPPAPPQRAAFERQASTFNPTVATELDLHPSVVRE